MRDIRLLGLTMRDENVPATLSITENEVVVTSTTDLDENEKDKLVKRFAERIIQLGLSMHDRKEKN